MVLRMRCEMTGLCFYYLLIMWDTSKHAGRELKREKLLTNVWAAN